MTEGNERGMEDKLLLLSAVAFEVDTVGILILKVYGKMAFLGN